MTVAESGHEKAISEINSLVSALIERIGSGSDDSSVLDQEAIKAPSPRAPRFSTKEFVPHMATLFAHFPDKRGISTPDFAFFRLSLRLTLCPEVGGNLVNRMK
jgi:hypothetical protein